MSPTQRKLFYAAGRFWILYSDGTELVYKSSPDGLSWSARSASLGALGSGDGLSIHFDGTYVHYARSTGTNGEPLYYRRGVPIADGTIEWSAGEQVAVAGVTGVHYVHPSVSADSSGHALVSYHYEKQNNKAGEGPYVTKSGNNDGTWGSTPAGFSHQLASDSESEWYTTVHGLTADKIGVTFADHTNVKGISVATYDGAAWNSIQTTASTSLSGSSYSAVAQGDDIHLALLRVSTYDILYCQYAYATNTLGSEYALLNAATASSMPSLAKDSNNDLYCFWPGAPVAIHIYYMRMISGVWDAGYTDWLTETNLASGVGVSAFHDQGGSDYIGVAWETGSASPYDIRFAAVSTATLPNQAPEQPGNVSPADAATGQSLTPTLQSSGFVDADSGDTHGSSQWQIAATSGNYTSPVYDSLTDSANLLSIMVPAGQLRFSTGYYWHVRHQDNHGDWSDWSAETSFSTISAPNQIPSQPANQSPVNGAAGQSLTPTLQSSAFSDPDSGDTHGASQWQIAATSGNYTSPVYDSLTDNVNLLGFPVPADKLGYSATYYWRVRYQDNHGDRSDWSVETFFSTAAAPVEPPEQPPNQPLNELPNQPGNILPVNAADGQSLMPMLQSADFLDPDAEDTHGASQWQIRSASGDYASPVFDSQTDNTNLLGILVPSGRLSYSTTYYWHVRYQDNHGDWSDWSVETPFSTASAPSQPPDEPDDENTVPPVPDADSDRGFLPFVVAITAGIAAVLTVGSGLFFANAAYTRLASRPRGLRSVRTISKRLRK